MGKPSTLPTEERGNYHSFKNELFNNKEGEFKLETYDPIKGYEGISGLDIEAQEQEFKDKLKLPKQSNEEVLDLPLGKAVSAIGHEIGLGAGDQVLAEEIEYFSSAKFLNTAQLVLLQSKAINDIVKYTKQADADFEPLGNRSDIKSNFQKRLVESEISSSHCVKACLAVKAIDKELNLRLGEMIQIKEILSGDEYRKHDVIVRSGDYERIYNTASVTKAKAIADSKLFSAAISGIWALGVVVVSKKHIKHLEGSNNIGFGTRMVEGLQVALAKVGGAVASNEPQAPIGPERKSKVISQDLDVQKVFEDILKFEKFASDNPISEIRSANADIVRLLNKNGVTKFPESPQVRVDEFGRFVDKLLPLAMQKGVAAYNQYTRTGNAISLHIDEKEPEWIKDTSRYDYLSDQVFPVEGGSHDQIKFETTTKLKQVPDFQVASLKNGINEIYRAGYGTKHVIDNNLFAKAINLVGQELDFSLTDQIRNLEGMENKYSFKSQVLAKLAENQIVDLAQIALLYQQAATYIVEYAKMAGAEIEDPNKSVERLTSSGKCIKACLVTKALKTEMDKRFVQLKIAAEYVKDSQLPFLEFEMKAKEKSGDEFVIRGFDNKSDLKVRKGVVERFKREVARQTTGSTSSNIALILANI